MIRLLLAFTLGTLVSLTLFFAMSQIILNDDAIGHQSIQGPVVEFIRLEKKKVVKKDPLPPKPVFDRKPVKPIPVVQAIGVPQIPAPKKPELAVKSPSPEWKLDLGHGPFLSSKYRVRKSQEAMPLVRIEPKYPRKAARQGLEGWVRLKFDVTASGAVSNVRIVDSKPRRIFDRAAKQSLLQWKYQPKMVNGQAIAKRGNVIQLDFKLTE